MDANLQGDGSAGVAISFSEPLGFLPEASVQHLDEFLGRGGSGIVKKGILQLHGLPQPVAIKELAPGASVREQEDFIREFRVAYAASQRCSGACRMYGCVHRGHALCLVMEQYSHSLADMLDDRRDGTPLSVPEALTIAHQIATSLQQLHAAGIVVRDLKPSNVLADDQGRLVISDFGIALVAEATLTRATVTGTGRPKGTTGYMSPELWNPDDLGRAIDKTDVWAWACVVVEMLSGNRPWRGKSEQQIMFQVVMKKAVPKIPAGMPARLDALLRRCFAYVAAERPTSAEVAAEVQSMLAEHELRQQAEREQAQVAVDLEKIPAVVWTKVEELIAQHTQPLLQKITQQQELIVGMQAQLDHQKAELLKHQEHVALVQAQFEHQTADLCATQPKPEPQPKSQKVQPPSGAIFEVNQAGTARVNGFYIPDGELNGRPRYRKVTAAI